MEEENDTFCTLGVGTIKMLLCSTSGIASYKFYEFSDLIETIITAFQVL